MGPSFSRECGRRLKRNSLIWKDIHGHAGSYGGRVSDRRADRGAIGALIGSQVDHALFSPKAAKGARLDRLAVQGSSYDADLPRLFGTMRVAGTVIWSTDLQESSHASGGGKGKPSSTSYSDSASFAVALSARPIRSVGRIWADGALLRGAGGD
jgi:hypothetical protein